MGTDTVAARRAAIGGCSERGGDLYLATRGDLELATHGDFFMATDSRRMSRKHWFVAIRYSHVENWASPREPAHRPTSRKEHVLSGVLSRVPVPQHPDAQPQYPS